MTDCVSFCLCTALISSSEDSEEGNSEDVESLKSESDSSEDLEEMVTIHCCTTVVNI